MTNREKIILGITAVAAIGGGLYHTLMASGTPAYAVGDELVDHSGLIARVQVSLNQGELTDREEHVLAAATTQWIRNPLRSRPLHSPEDGTSPAVPLPRYVGFINSGPRPIAIIDGRDYRTGETIRGGEFQVTQIFSDRIELLRRGASSSMTVPLDKPQVPGGVRDYD